MFPTVSLRNRGGKPTHLLVVLVPFRLVFVASYKIYYVVFFFCFKGGPWLSGRVLAWGPVGPGINTPPGHGWCGRQAS